MKVIMDIRRYRAVSNRIAELNKKIDYVVKKEHSLKLSQKIESTGLLYRFRAKLDVLLQSRYQMECDSTTIRILATLHLI